MASEQDIVLYRPVPGFPGYRVGDDGSVWSCRSRNGIGPLKDVWHSLRQQRIGGGPGKRYPAVTLYPGQRQRLVHLLILEAFVGPCPDGMQCLHNDGDPGNNRLSNLRWGTRVENAADRRRHGTCPIGERNGCALLDTDKVRAIRLARATTRKTLKQIGQEYGVSLHTVHLIVKRRNWKHVD
jgi:hypothetical protein